MGSWDSYGPGPPQSSEFVIINIYYNLALFIGEGDQLSVRIDSVNSLIRDKIGNSSYVRILFRVSLSNQVLKGRVYSFRPKHHPPREVASGLRQLITLLITYIYYNIIKALFYYPPEYNGKATGKHSEILLLTLPVGWVGGATKFVHLKKIHHRFI